VPPGEVVARLRTILREGLARMKLEQIDLFFLHDTIVADIDHVRYNGTPNLLWSSVCRGSAPV